MKRPVVLIAISLLLSIGSLVTGGLIWGGKRLYRAYRSFPDYAKREVVYAKYETLLADLDEAIAQSSSAEDLETRLSKIARPSNLVYLGLEGEDDFDTDIIGDDSGNVRTFVFNGSGYGRINDQDIIIISYPVEKFDIENCLIYLLQED